jgi:hypothetical protein
MNNYINKLNLNTSTIIQTSAESTASLGSLTGRYTVKRLWQPNIIYITLRLNYSAQWLIRVSDLKVITQNLCYKILFSNDKSNCYVRWMNGKLLFCNSSSPVV